MTANSPKSWDRDLDRVDRDPFKAAADKAEISLSREDDDSICSLADLLAEPLDPIADLYARELARLRLRARVTTFLPLVVSRLVRRLRARGRSEARGTAS
jgi:hypothetical protein